MLRRESRSIRHRPIIAAAVCIIAGCTDPSDPALSVMPENRYGAQIPWAANPELSKALAALRDTTDAYHDIDVALAAGYRPSAAGCESIATGAMGIHYGHPALLGVVRGSNPVRGTDPAIDPLRPEVLLYEPQSDGTRRLVGVEFVVYRAAWDAANPGKKPTFAGVPFNEMFGPLSHGHTDHYELHVWIWRNNPMGMFEPWNPKVSCAL
jgi:hypothetical protein